MTRALSASFKSQLLALVDRTHLTPAELVLAALEIAVRHAGAAGHDRAALHGHLDQAIIQAAPDVTGAIDDLPSLDGGANERGGSMADLVHSLVARAKALVNAVKNDECGVNVGGQFMGGNGGLLSLESIKAADALRLAIGAYEAASEAEAHK